MNQATFSFVPPQAEACDRTGFDLGWDHAHHGLVPPAELLLDGTPVSQGWRAGKAVFGRRTLGSTRAVRQWLALRTLAWRRGIAFEGTQVTAHYVAQIDSAWCPVTRRPLGGAGGAPDAPVVERLNAAAGYAAGNLAVISQRAAAAREGAGDRDGAAAALRRAARVEAGIEMPPEGLDAAETWRLAVLTSFVTPLPFCEAARIPLRVLPPNRVRLLNAVQGLQALLTVQFSTPGWSTRVRALAELLPQSTHGQALRHDFQLFVGALAPRLLEAGAGHDARATRRALEDAWADARLNRRWQQFVLALGETGTEALLQRAAEAGLAGVRTLLHAPEQATEGWALASSGRQLSAARRPLAPPADPRRTAVRPPAPASRA
jgi:hypothetical protein